MSKDFRASQIQTTQIVASGSSSTNARIVVYPVEGQSTVTPNQGIIDSDVFGTSSIGNDVFLFVSGAIGGKDAGSNTISVFGGDVHISGNLSIDGSGGGGASFFYSETADIIDASGSLELTGALYVKGTGAFDGTLKIASPTYPFEPGTLGSGAPVWTDEIAVAMAWGSKFTAMVSSSVDTSRDVIRLFDGTTLGKSYYDNVLFYGDSGYDAMVFANGQTAIVMSQKSGSVLFANQTGDQTWTVTSEVDPSARAPFQGADNFLFVSGAVGGKDGSAPTISLFGGDVHISGNLTVDGTAPGGSGSGNLIWQSDVVNLAYATGSIEVTGSGLFKGGISGSLTRLDDGSPYLLAGDNVTLVTNSLGQIEITSSIAGLTSTDYYDGYVSSSLTWTSTTWAEVTTVASGFQDKLASGITRSGSTFTVSETGKYFWTSRFNNFDANGYIGFRLSGSNGTIIQHTDFVGGAQSPALLQGVLELTASDSFVLEYAVDATFSTYNNTTLDGETGVSGRVSMFLLGGGGGGSGNTIWNSDVADLAFTTGSIEVTGSALVKDGITGSLTRLPDGNAYIAAGDNITIVTNSLGQVEISGAAGGGGGGSTSIVVSGSEWTTVYEVDFGALANQDILADGPLAITGSIGTFVWDRVNFSSAATYASISSGLGVEISCNTTNTAWFNNSRANPLLVLPLSGILPSGIDFSNTDIRLVFNSSGSNNGENFEAVRAGLERSSSLGGNLFNVQASLVYNAGLGWEWTRTFSGTSTTERTTFTAGEEAIELYVTEPESVWVGIGTSGSEQGTEDQIKSRARIRFGAPDDIIADDELTDNLKDYNFVWGPSTSNTSGDLFGYLKYFKLQYRHKGGVTVLPTGSTQIRSEITDFASTTSTSSNPATVGQIVYNPAEYTGSITLRGVLTNQSASVTSSIRLFNVSALGYVELDGAGGTVLNSVGTTPTIVTSADLRGATNFWNNQAIYELQLYTSDATQTAYVGGAELRTVGLLVTASSANTYADTFDASVWEIDGTEQRYMISASVHGLQTSNMQIQLFQSLSNGYALVTAQETLINSSFDVRFTIASGSEFAGRAVLQKAGTTVEDGWENIGGTLSTSASVAMGSNVAIGGQAYPLDSGSLTLDGTSLLTDCNQSNVHFHLMVTGGISLSTASNQQQGASYTWLVTQDGTGGHSLAFDTNYFTIIGNNNTIITGANKTTVLSGISDGSKIFLAVAGDES